MVPCGHAFVIYQFVSSNMGVKDLFNVSASDNYTLLLQGSLLISI